MFRLIEILAPIAAREHLITILDDTDAISRWPLIEGPDSVSARLLVDVQSSGEWIDRLESLLSDIDDYRLVLLPVEATVPRPREPEDSEVPEDDEEVKRPNRLRGISRDELIDELLDGITPSFNYFAFVVISVLVAIVGLVNDNIAVVVGAMVLAPLLTPNVALALASTLGDLNLARKATLTGTFGAGAALLLSIVVGALFDLRLDSAQMLLRTSISVGDVLVALAAGAAGVLALTGGASASLIGVMVAVALMPPLVAAGLYIGAAQWPHALGASGLFAVNLLAVNLAGVLCFLIRGIRPRGWYQAERAWKRAWIAVAVWVVLLGALLGLLHMAGVLRFG